MIRAGTLSEVRRDSGKWVFVDIGFAEKAKSCGVLVEHEEPREIRFADLREIIVKVIGSSNSPVNLLLEAPLSVAFNAEGNPTGRSVERRGMSSRYWYVGLGCSVLVGATYLLRAIYDAQLSEDIHLFEGLASFKAKGAMSSHKADVVALKEVVWHSSSLNGSIVAPAALKRHDSDTLQSAFAVAGMDCGVPPVVVLNH